MQSLGDAVAILERHRFFQMRLNPARALYIDGPEDEIIAARCGVTTTLGTIGRGGEAELNDDQGKAFVKLEDDLRRVIFSEKWALPTPAP